MIESIRGLLRFQNDQFQFLKSLTSSSTGNDTFRQCKILNDENRSMWRLFSQTNFETDLLNDEESLEEWRAGKEGGLQPSSMKMSNDDEELLTKGLEAPQGGFW
jgi:hypothetical protein